MADEHLISLQPGTIVGGRYEVVKCLGAGSMGLVYACRHRELQGHLVAIKVLFPEVAQDKTAAARFRNEIFASYGVSHPNVVRAYEYIKDGDLVAYTMEYVGGGDLADRLGKSNQQLTILESLRILSQMCAGVQAIHDAGIIHRDLKPENILLTKEGNVKIADFGIARTGHGPKLTEHGGVVGTIDYVSPEYMLNSHVDWRSDIYALGILGYEMIAGESPFRGDSVYATMTKRLKNDPELPSSKRSDCPKELDTIILKAMKRDPEERYQSAAEMFNDLTAIMPQGSVTKMYGTVAQARPVMTVAADGPSAGASLTSSESSIASLTESSRTTQLPSQSAHSGYVPQVEATVQLNAGSKNGIGLDLDRTQVVNPELSKIVTHFDESLEDVQQTTFEPLLGYRSRSGSGWRPDGSSNNNGNRGESMDVHVETRMGGDSLRRLSEYSQPKKSSAWLDILTLLVAALIGVGVGYFVVQYLKDHNIAGFGSKTVQYNMIIEDQGGSRVA
jgi:serine/threonine protein kinase